MANEYKKTTNLPRTGFPMRASLAQNEPKRLALWNQNALYELLMKKNEGHEKFVLHDGPPYANGPIHLGHAQNKISKDIINRYKAMRGFQVDVIFLAIAIIGLLGLVTDQLFRFLRLRVAAWAQ